MKYEYQMRCGICGKLSNGEHWDCDDLCFACAAPEKTKTTHTPGPWQHNAIKPFTDFDGKHHDGLACAVWANGKVPIARTDFSVGKYHETSPEVQDANARLIASAPELLDALEELLAFAPKPKSVKKDFSYTLRRAIASKVIAKAKGDWK